MLGGYTSFRAAHPRVEIEAIDPSSGNDNGSHYRYRRGGRTAPIHVLNRVLQTRMAMVCLLD